MVSGAAVGILSALLGDSVTIADSTYISAGHEVRTFASLDEAGRESADSRLYGGVHYPMAIERGLDQGRCVARLVLERVRTR